MSIDELPLTDIPTQVDSAFRRDQKQPSLLSLWWSEIAAIMLSVTALIAIFALVYPYRILRPIPNWPSEITINAIISILSVILRAGIVVATAEALSQQKWIWFCKDRTLVDLLRFDQATRGPWGSFILPFGLSGMSLMGSFGALIMVLAVAVGPFAQQLVHYETCSLASTTNNATAHRQGLYYLTGQHINSIFNRPEYSMQLAINAGIFAPQANAVPVVCPSRNCTFANTFSTVGYCSSCTDVTDKLNIDMYRINQTKPYTYTDAHNVTILMNSTVSLFIANLSLSTGSSLYLNSSDFETEIYMTAQNGRYSGNMGPWDIIYTSAYGSEPVKKNCTAQQAVDPLLSWDCQGYGAATCDLSPCVHTYSVNVTDGIATEKLLGTSSTWGRGGNLQDSVMLNIPCLGPEGRQAVRDQGYKFNDSAEWLAYNTSLDHSSGYWYNSSSRVSGAPPQCLYEIGMLSINAIQYYVGNILEGNITADLSSYKGPAALQILFNNTYASFAQVDSVFKNISMGVTSNMRQIGNWTGYKVPENVSNIIGAPNQPALGLIMVTQSCVAVRWGWLAFPAGMILLATLFLVLTIMDTTFNDNLKAPGQYGQSLPKSSMLRPAATWKSSVLPLLFHGLEDSNLRYTYPNRFASEEEMEGAAKVIKTRFAPSKDGWKMTKVD